jgi:hypothetical protein
MITLGQPQEEMSNVLAISGDDKDTASTYQLHEAIWWNIEGQERMADT